MAGMEEDFLFLCLWYRSLHEADSLKFVNLPEWPKLQVTAQRSGTQHQCQNWNSRQDQRPQERTVKSWKTLKTRFPLHFSIWGEIKLRKAEFMAQMHGLLVAEIKYKAGNLPVLYLRRVVMEYQDIYHSWKHRRRKFLEMYDSRFHFYFMTHQWNIDPATINPFLVCGLFKARAWGLIKGRLLMSEKEK